MVTNKSGDTELIEKTELIRDAILIDQLALIKHSYADLISVYRQHADDFKKNNYDRIVHNIKLNDRVSSGYKLLINRVKGYWQSFNAGEKARIGKLVKQLVREALAFKINNKL